MIEKEIKKKVSALLKARGAWFFMPVQMGYGAASVDFIGAYRGRAFGIETKRPEVKKATARQVFVMEAIRQAGGFTCLENDPECSNVQAMLEQIDRLGI